MMVIPINFEICQGAGDQPLGSHVVDNMLEPVCEHYSAENHYVLWIIFLLHTICLWI